MKYGILDEGLFLRFLEAYRRFYVEVNKKYPDDIYWGNFVKWVSQNLHNPDFLFLIAVDGKKIRGFSIVSPVINLEGIKTALVEPLYVFPEHRNKGIGKILLKLVMGWLEQKGYQKVITFESYKSNVFRRKQKTMGMKPVKVLLERDL